MTILNDMAFWIADQTAILKARPVTWVDWVSLFIFKLFSKGIIPFHHMNCLLFYLLIILIKIFFSVSLCDPPVAIDLERNSMYTSLAFLSNIALMI